MSVQQQSAATRTTTILLATVVLLHLLLPNYFCILRALSFSLSLSLSTYVCTYIHMCIHLHIHMCIYMNIYTDYYHTTSAYYVCWIYSLSCLCHRCPLPLPCERSMCLTGTGILTAEKWWRRRKHVHLKSPRDQTGIRPLPRTSSACSRQKRPLARRRMRCECVCVCVCHLPCLRRMSMRLVGVRALLCAHLHSCAPCFRFYLHVHVMCMYV